MLLFVLLYLCLTISPIRWDKVRVARAVQSQVVLFTREDHFNAIIRQIEVRSVSPPLFFYYLLKILLFG